MALLVDLAHLAQDEFQRRQLKLCAQRVLETLRESEERHRQLIDHSPEAYLVNDGSVFTFVDPAGLRLLGAHSSEQIIGRSPIEFIAPEYRAIVRQRVAHGFATMRPNAAMEMKWLRVDGTEVDVEITTVSFTSNGKSHLQLIARDNTVRKQYKNELEQLATQDVLTGLPNRAVLRDRLKQGVARWARQGQERSSPFSTWTISRILTKASATAPATRCWRRSAACSRHGCAGTIPWHASGTMSSCSFSRKSAMTSCTRCWNACSNSN